MVGPSESKTSKNRLTAVDRQAKALALRKAGIGYQEIAAELGYAGPAGAYKAIQTALRKTIQEPADEVRSLELARLDSMLRAIWTRILDGNDYAIDRGLKIMERRAKMLGLDAPTKVNIDLIVKRAAEELGLDSVEAATLHSEVSAFLADAKAGVS